MHKIICSLPKLKLLKSNGVLDAASDSRIFQSLEMATLVVEIIEAFCSPGCAVASPGLINIVAKGTN